MSDHQQPREFTDKDFEVILRQLRDQKMNLRARKELVVNGMHMARLLGHINQPSDFIRMLFPQHPESEQ